MENGTISDDQITAASHYDVPQRAANGRQNFVAGGDKRGSWSSKINDVNHWLQADFQRSTIITGISTQGRQDHYQFVKSYTISFSDDEINFNCYKTGENLKVFQGNSDQNSLSITKFHLLLLHNLFASILLSGMAI